MAVTSWKSPATITQETHSGAGRSSWSNVTNAGVSDNNYATTDVDNAGSHWLQCVNFSFSTSDIPSGSTINGIEVNIERHGENSLFPNTDEDLYLVYSGTIQTGWTNKASGTSWPTSDTVATYGGAADLWGGSGTITDSGIRSSNFGVAFSA